MEILKKTMEIFRKTMDFFRKISHVFRISWEIIEGTREKTRNGRLNRLMAVNKARSKRGRRNTQKTREKEK